MQTQLAQPVRTRVRNLQARVGGIHVPGNFFYLEKGADRGNRHEVNELQRQSLMKPD